MQVAFSESFGWRDGQFYYAPKRRQQIRQFYESVNPGLVVRFTLAGDLCVDARNGEDFGMLMARQFRKSQQTLLAALAWRGGRSGKWDVLSVQVAKSV
jgi:hypothetical protein